MIFTINMMDDLTCLSSLSHGWNIFHAWSEWSKLWRWWWTNENQGIASLMITLILYIVKKKNKSIFYLISYQKRDLINSLPQDSPVKRLKQGTTYLQDTHSECISEYFMCFRVVTISDVCGCDEQLKWVVLFHIKFSAFNFFLELTHSFLSVAWENKQKSM